MKQSLRFHFIGIGGIGMSALARILLDRGYHVQGSDTNLKGYTKELIDLGALVFEGHSNDHITGDLIVVVSTAIKEDNPELIQAKAKQLRILHRAELLKELSQDATTLLVTGTHGKTTTSGMLAFVLHYAHKDPSFAIGGYIQNLHLNGKGGQGNFFIAEADESDGSFLQYRGDAAIITNLEADHLDYWKSLVHLKNGFKKFSDGITKQELLVWCKDDELLCELELPGTSYGFSTHSEIQITNYEQTGFTSTWDLLRDGKFLTTITVSLVGKHNALNATAVFILSSKLGIDEIVIKKALQEFRGMGRRLEKKGEICGITIYDDYGHHPTEIKTTLYSLKKAFPTKRLVTIFQPHRYSRVRDCFDEFTECFHDADVVVVTQIYSAGEKPILGVTDEALFKAIRKKKDTTVFLSKQNIVKDLLQVVKEGDIVLTIGAGDITNLGPDLIEMML